MYPSPHFLVNTLNSKYFYVDVTQQSQPLTDVFLNFFYIVSNNWLSQFLLSIKKQKKVKQRSITLMKQHMTKN